MANDDKVFTSNHIIVLVTIRFKVLSIFYVLICCVSFIYFRKECTAKLIATVTSYNFRKIWEIVRQQNLFTEAEEQAMYRSNSNDY